MVKVLDNAIETYNLESQEDFCSFLLKQLENAGMMPPEDPTCKYSTKQAGEAYAWEKE